MQNHTIIAPKPDTLSWWFQDAVAAEGGAEPYGAPVGQTRADVVIVGGGFTGLWTALRLKQKAQNLSVVVLEGGLCGSGASGKNGGKVHGYWSGLGTLVANFGETKALEIARLGTLAQDRIRDLATKSGHDVWWREGGNLRAITTARQEAKAKAALATALRLGVPQSVQAVSAAEMATKVASPAFKSGLYLPEGATVHPARLARALREACLKAGVLVYENSPMLRYDEGSPNRVVHKTGEIHCRKLVLATNTALSGHKQVASHLALFSSFAIMTQSVEDIAEKLGWRGNEGLADLRMFVHYFRKAGSERLLMGSGSGPIAYGAHWQSPLLTEDQAAADRAVGAIRRFFPQLAEVAISKSWGGGIDMSPDRLPFFVPSPSGNVFIGAGFSGHGVNATCIAGECLSGLVLGIKDIWTTSPFCKRDLAKFPPEPFKTYGGRLVRASILGCEDAEEHGRSGNIAQRAGAELPRILGIKVGTR